MPCRQLAHVFWMALCRAEETRHTLVESHAFTAWWVHNSIEFAEGVPHYSWEDWAEMRGLNYGKRKSRAEIVAEINARFDQAFNAALSFVPVGVGR